MKSKSELTIIIPTLGQAKGLSALLDSLADQKTDFIFDVLLIDNSLNNDVFLSLDHLAKQQKRLTVQLVKAEQKGVNYARNLGIKQSESNILFFIDDDCWLNDKFLLSKHLKLHQSHEDVFALGGHYSLGNQAHFLDRCYHQIQMRWLQKGIIDNQTKRTRYLIGGHCSIKKNSLLGANLQFDELIKYGGSELSLFLKAYNQGLIMNLENMSLVHVPNLSFVSLAKKLFKQGQGKAYLNDFSSVEAVDESAPFNETSQLEQIAIYFLNLFFWLGFYNKSESSLTILKHIGTDLVGQFQSKRYKALDKINQQLKEKNDRGDRL